MVGEEPDVGHGLWPIRRRGGVPQLTGLENLEDMGRRIGPKLDGFQKTERGWAIVAAAAQDPSRGVEAFSDEVGLDADPMRELDTGVFPIEVSHANLDGLTAAAMDLGKTGTVAQRHGHKKVGVGRLGAHRAEVVVLLLLAPEVGNGRVVGDAAESFLQVLVAIQSGKLRCQAERGCDGGRGVGIGECEGTSPLAGQRPVSGRIIEETEQLEGALPAPDGGLGGARRLGQPLGLEFDEETIVGIFWKGRGEDKNGSGKGKEERGGEPGGRMSWTSRPQSE